MLACPPKCPGSICERNRSLIDAADCKQAVTLARLLDCCGSG